uniref:Uncharacterized protein n=1 Tax=Tetranychus urticae TaxID=32264 RepID=T1KYP2_TETUR
MNPSQRSLQSTESSTSLVSLSPSLSSSSPSISSGQSLYLDSMDSDCAKSEISSPSSPPSSDDNFDYPPIDFSVLEQKLAALGLSRYTVYPSALKGRRSLNSQSSYYSSEEDDDEVFMVITRNGKKQYRRPPMLRSKSLKTELTPPETPKKKMVRFADALGLKFENIHWISQDELPIIPKSAYQHLKLSEAEQKVYISVTI